MDVLERPQARHRRRDGAAGIVEDRGEPLRLHHRRLDPVEAEEVGDLLGVVDDVVESGGERVDVLAVDRRDERLVEALDDVVGDPVAFVLAGEHIATEVAVVGPRLEHLLEEAGRLDDVRAGLLEEVEELALLRREEPAQLRHGVRV
jgi:hypothetical protein